MLHLLKKFLRPAAGCARRWGHWLQGPPNYRSLATLGEFGRAQPRVRFDVRRVSAPGWLSMVEGNALYSIARWAPGPFLEIGPWLGRSTITIALGIADSGESKEFVTREINPTLANFRPTAGGMIGFYLPAESTESMGLCTPEVFEREIKPVIEHPSGLRGQLAANLQRSGVDRYVRMSFGDFRTLEPRAYRFVFTDAMHDETEIRRNAPELHRFLVPGTILACHDTHDANEQLLREFFAFGDTFRADSIFVGQLARV
jgi:hypothetical protein